MKKYYFVSKDGVMLYVIGREKIPAGVRGFLTPEKAQASYDRAQKTAAKSRRWYVSDAGGLMEVVEVASSKDVPKGSRSFKTPEDAGKALEAACDADVKKYPMGKEVHDALAEGQADYENWMKERKLR